MTGKDYEHTKDDHARRGSSVATGVLLVPATPAAAAATCIALAAGELAGRARSSLKPKATSRKDSASRSSSALAAVRTMTGAHDGGGQGVPSGCVTSMGEDVAPRQALAARLPTMRIPLTAVIFVRARCLT
ncbi:hypothetical protein [Streptomyces sp. NPDC054794]